MRQVLCEGLQLADELGLRPLCMYDTSEGPQDALRRIDRHRDDGHVAVVYVQLMPVEKAEAPAGSDIQISAAAANTQPVPGKRRRPLQVLIVTAWLVLYMHVMGMVRTSHLSCSCLELSMQLVWKADQAAVPSLHLATAVRGP